MRKTKLPRRKRRTRARSVLTPEQFRRLLDVLHEPSRSLVILLTVAGVRIGEALALRWRNVDLPRKLLRIQERVYDGDFDDPKMEESVRELELPPVAVRVLRQRAGNGEIEPDALVFQTGAGTPYDRRTLLRRQLKPACVKLGIAGVNWHSLRHAYVTAHSSVRTPLGAVQALVGHSSSEITREVYMHSYLRERRKAVERVEKFFFGPKRTQVFPKKKNGEAVIQ